MKTFYFSFFFLLLGQGLLVSQHLPHLWHTDSTYFQQLFHAVGEPVLGEQAEPYPTFRFILYRSLDPMVLFRFQQVREDSFLVVMKHLNGERPPEVKFSKFRVYDGMIFDEESEHFFPKYVPVEILEEKLSPVTVNQGRAFLALVAKNEFFEQDSLVKRGGGKDGSVWLMEAWMEETYHFVAVKNPEEGWFRSLCLLLIEFSGTEIEYLY